MVKWCTLLSFVILCLYSSECKIDDRCYGTNPCHNHELECEPNSKIAISNLFHGFNTCTAACNSTCCQYQDDDCNIRFNHTLQHIVHEKCELRETCQLKQSYRISGCDSHNSKYSRVEYQCLPESLMMSGVGSLTNQNVNLLYSPSVDIESQTSDKTLNNSVCTVNSAGRVQVTKFYSLVYPRQNMVAAADDSDCIDFKVSIVDVNGEYLYMLCHSDVEEFYQELHATRPDQLPLTVTIRDLLHDDTVWIGFSAADDHDLTLTCTNLVSNGLSQSHDGPQVLTYILIGAGLLLILVLGIVTLICYRQRKPSKNISKNARSYGEVATDDIPDHNHYVYIDLPADVHSVQSTKTIKDTQVKKDNSSSDTYNHLQDFKPIGAADAQRVAVIQVKKDNSSSDIYNHLQDFKPVGAADAQRVAVIQLKKDNSSSVIYNHLQDYKPAGASDTHTVAVTQVKNDNSSSDNCNHLQDFKPVGAADAHVHVVTATQVKNDLASDTYNHLQNFRQVKVDNYNAEYSDINTDIRGNNPTPSLIPGTLECRDTGH